MPLLEKQASPKEWGIQDDTRTVISATSIGNGNGANFASPSIGVYAFAVLDEFYASLDLPAGAIIDMIGVNSTTDTDGVLGVALWSRDKFANYTLLEGFSVPAHGWATDYSGPLSIQVTDHVDKELVLNVETASDHLQFFAWAEVWWHRTVSPPPATPSFNDVPPDHPFYQFIEAIHAAGITAGCGNGNFCPDQPITRKQEAAFIAKALGLHWPN
jgi:hypothetical protein